MTDVDNGVIWNSMMGLVFLEDLIISDLPRKRVSQEKIRMIKKFIEEGRIR